MDLLLFLVLGACAGLLAGLFGVGGGLIIVPVLVYSFTAKGLDPDILTTWRWAPRWPPSSSPR